MDSKSNHSCKYCVLKQKLVPGSANNCLNHTFISIPNACNEHINHYPPPSKKLTLGSNHQQPSINEVSISSLNKQIEDLHYSIRKVQMCIDVSARPLQNQMVSTLGQCFELLKKKCTRFEDK